MKRVIVTGGTGFIGRHAARALVARGFEVHVLSRHGFAGVSSEPTIQHAVDLLDATATEAVVTAIKPTHLLHLAWDVTPGKYWTSLNNLSWVAASLLLFRAFRDAGGQRTVYAGSCAEYDWSHTQLSETETPLRPRTLYGRAKNALRDVIEAAGAASGVSTAWGRVFFLYGPGEPRGRLVSDAFYALLTGTTMAATDGLQERDFMHVADVGAAFAALVDSGVIGAVNIASGRCVSVRHILDVIGRLTGRPDLLAMGARPSNPDEPRRLGADVTRLVSEVHFASHYVLEEGLSDTLKWWKEQIAASKS